MKSFYNVLAVSALALALVVICAPAMAQQAPQTAPEPTISEQAPPNADALDKLVAAYQAGLADAPALPSACKILQDFDAGVIKLFGECVQKDGARSNEFIADITIEKVTNENAETLAADVVTKLKAFANKILAQDRNNELAKQINFTPEENAAVQAFVTLLRSTPTPPALMEKAKNLKASFALAVFDCDGTKLLLVHVGIPGNNGVVSYTLTTRYPFAPLATDPLPPIVQKILTDAESFLDSLAK